jgi:hypothetical protein
MDIGIREAFRLPWFAILHFPAAAYIDYNVLSAQSLPAAYEGTFSLEYN